MVSYTTAANGLCIKRALRKPGYALKREVAAPLARVVSVEYVWSRTGRKNTGKQRVMFAKLLWQTNFHTNLLKVFSGRTAWRFTGFYDAKV